MYVRHAQGRGRRRAEAGSAEAPQERGGCCARQATRRVGLRFAPELRFFYDDRLDDGNGIEELLEEVKAESGPSSRWLSLMLELRTRRRATTVSSPMSKREVRPSMSDVRRREGRARAGRSTSWLAAVACVTVPPNLERDELGALDPLGALVERVHLAAERGGELVVPDLAGIGRVVGWTKASRGKRMSDARSGLSRRMASKRCCARRVSSSLVAAGRAPSSAAAAFADAPKSAALVRSPRRRGSRVGRRVGPASLRLAPRLAPAERSAEGEPERERRSRAPSHARFGSVTMSTWSTSSNARISLRHASLGR